MTVQQRTVLLIGSNDLLWCSLRVALRSLDEVQVVADLVDPRHASDCASDCNPDAVLVRLSDGGLDPSVLSFLQELRATCTAARVIIFTPSLHPEEFLTLVGLGIRGCIYWRDLDVSTLRSCLEAVLSAELTVASRSVPAELLNTQHQQAAIPLTDREQTVLNALAEGLTQKAIAASLHLSLRTVKRTVASLEQKLGAPSQFALGLKARAFRLVSATN